MPSNVGELDGKNTRAQPLDLAGQTIAILHHDYVCFFPREERRREENNTAENDDPNIHSVFVIRHPGV